MIAKKSLKDSADEIEFKTVRIGTLEATLRQLEHDLQTQAEMLEKDYSLQLNEKVLFSGENIFCIVFDHVMN